MPIYLKVSIIVIVLFAACLRIILPLILKDREHHSIFFMSPPKIKSKIGKFGFTLGITGVIFYFFYIVELIWTDMGRTGNLLTLQILVGGASLLCVLGLVFVILGRITRN